MTTPETATKLSFVVPPSWGRLDCVHANAGLLRSTADGQTIDIARAVAFLLSDAAGFINGSIVHLEGGTLALPPW